MERLHMERVEMSGATVRAVRDLSPGGCEG